MTSDDARALAAHTSGQRAARAAAPSPLKLATACPRCGAAVTSEASDFCEACSAHLYPGHCVFCLEPFVSGQPHCRGCGLPPEGVLCGLCGTFSRFDFCPNPDCGAGLTPRAAAELARVEGDAEVLEAFAALDEIAAVMAAVEANGPLPLPLPPPLPLPVAEAPANAQPVVPGERPQAAGSTLPTAAATAAATAAPARIAATAPPTRPSLAALRAAAQGAKSAEEKARVRKLAEQAAQDSLNAVTSRPFPTAQEARAAGTALQVALRCRVVTERLETIAWRCNRYGAEHPEPGGMSLCSDPSSGGVPIMRVITEVDDRSAEFEA